MLCFANISSTSFSTHYQLERETCTLSLIFNLECVESQSPFLIAHTSCCAPLSQLQEQLAANILSNHNKLKRVGAVAQTTLQKVIYYYVINDLITQNKQQEYTGIFSHF